MRRAKLLAYEYPLFRDFRCDLAIADSITRGLHLRRARGRGAPGVSLSSTATRRRGNGARALITGSPRSSWFYKIQDMTNTATMEARFGKRAIDYTGVLIVGRDQHMKPGEYDRLRWRREHIIVNSSKRIVCVTYDELLAERPDSPSLSGTGRLTTRWLDP